jgi:hypothetical protein
MAIGPDSPLDYDLIKKYRRQLDDAYDESARDYVLEDCARQEYLHDGCDSEYKEVTYPDMEWLPSDGPIGKRMKYDESPQPCANWPRPSEA